MLFLYSFLLDRTFYEVTHQDDRYYKLLLEHFLGRSWSESALATYFTPKVCHLLLEASQTIL